MAIYSADGKYVGDEYLDEFKIIAEIPDCTLIKKTRERIVL